MQGKKYTEELFWEKVDRETSPNGCWPWMASKNKRGYGSLSLKGKRTRAHRAAWSYANKQDIPPGMMVLHSCDNPPCCNPSHLRCGTQTENMKDRRDRGRAPTGERNGAVKHRDRISIVMKRIIDERGPLAFGEAHGHAKLSTSQVLDIIERYKSGGHTQRSLATEFGMSQRQIGRIVRGLGWQVALSRRESA